MYFINFLEDSYVELKLFAALNTVVAKERYASEIKETEIFSTQLSLLSCHLLFNFFFCLFSS